MRPRATLALVSSMALVAATGADPDADRSLAAQAIRPEALRAHMRFLADDLLEGRATGTRGYDLAALYVASQLEALGLDPAGSDGYYQSVPLRKASVAPESCGLELTHGGHTEALAYGKDYVLLPNFHREESEARGNVAFVGYGVSAPAFGHDDYAGLDVRGKLVAVLFGAPAKLPGDARAHFGSSAVKGAEAARRGAIGVFVLRQEQAERVFPWQRLVQHNRFAGLRWLDAAGRPNDAPEELRAAGVFSSAATEALFDQAGRKLKDVLKEVHEGRFTSFDTGLQASVRTASRHEAARAANVAGLLRGSDPRLRGETVVYSAHLDHMGIGEPVDGDAVFNGAFDNASGVAAMLEVARAYASAPQRPRRSVLFLAAAGEERGLLGADYFAQSPTVAGIVADLNLDTVLMLAPFKDLLAFGAEHSTLEADVRAAASLEGLEISADPWPEQGIFTRSDHYAFVKQGVPAVMLTPGFVSGDPKRDLAALSRDWLAHVYHTPKDDMSQPMDLEGGLRLARAAFFAGWSVAQADERPAWKPKDFFGETFGRASAEDVGPRLGGSVQAAQAAHERKDYSSALVNWLAAHEAAPRSTRVLYNLACAYARTRRPRDAVAALSRLADWGVAFDAAGDEDFSTLAERADFQAVVARFKALEQPAGGSSLPAFRVRERDLITEGIAYDPQSGDFFLSSVHRRKVVRVTPGGAARDFVGEGQDGLWAALAMAVDAKRRALWVTSTALPQMAGFRKEDEGRTALFEYDLDGGRLRRRLELPPVQSRHGANDLALDASGNVYLSDSRSSQILRLSAGRDALEVFVDAGRLESPQGMTPSADGRALYVADYARGLARIDLATRAVTPVDGPDDALLQGIDGLAEFGGALIGIQNGIRPHRVVRLELDEAGTRVTAVELLERAHTLFDEPTLGVVVGDEFYYVANSQWGAFEADFRIWPAERLKEPLVLRLPLKPASAGAGHAG